MWLLRNARIIAFDGPEPHGSGLVPNHGHRSRKFVRRHVPSPKEKLPERQRLDYDRKENKNQDPHR